MSAPDPDWDDEYAALLAAYDTQLSSGETSREHFDQFRSRLPDDFANRLEDAKSCLLLLRQVWRPSQRIGSRVRTLARRFEIVRELGRGGFGIVYLANDTVLGRMIALKVQRPEAIISASLRDRFVREAKAAARLRHPNIAAVYEMGDEGLQFWIATEYCDGDSLASWIGPQTSKIEAPAVAEFMAALADALEYSHQEGVLHRDLKPSNILLRRIADKNSPDVAPAMTLSAFTPKLIDFGLAKLLESDHQETRSGMLLGTPAYMAPEQATGQIRQIGPATDIYGLGTILYELLTGSPVFRGTSTADTLRQIVADDPVNPRQLRPELVRDIEAICLKCLQKQPDKRYPTAGALAADLRRFLHGVPTHARPLTRTKRLAKWTRRRPAFAGLLAVSLAASLTFIALNFVYIRQLNVGRETADALRADAEDSAESARQQERRASRYMYVSQIRRAYESLEQGDIQQARQSLEQYGPGNRLADLRGFEWYHLQRKMQDTQLTLRGHRGEVYAVAFSPDGRTLASGGQDGLIKLWDPLGGQELTTVAAHESCVNAVAYSPDGQFLASGSCDHLAKLWQTTTHELLATLKDHAGEVHCSAISPDGRLLATGGTDHLARVWDLTTRTIWTSMSTLDSTINAIAWHKDSRRLVVASGMHVYFWDAGDDRPAVMHEVTANCIAISPAGTEIALALNDGPIQIVDESGAELEELAGHPAGGAAALTFSPDGRWLVSGGHDRTIRLWGRGPNFCRQTLMGHTGRVQSLAFAPDSDLLASASFDGAVKLWKCQETEAVGKMPSDCQLFGDGDLRSSVAISPDLRYVAWRCSLSEAKVFDVRDRVVFDPLPPIEGAGPIRALSFVAGDPPRVFGIPPDANHVSTWDVTGHKLEGSFPIPPDRPPLPGVYHDLAGAPREVVLSPDGRHLISTDPTNATIVDTQTGEAWCNLSLKPAQRVNYHDRPSIHCSPDANTLVITLGDEPACLVELAQKRKTRLPLIKSLDIWAVANETKLIAKSGDRLSIAIVDPRSGREVYTLRHNLRVTCAVFSFDGQTFATGTRDGRVHLWNMATGEAMTQFETRSGEVLKLQFSPDSRKLAALTCSEVTSELTGHHGNIQLIVWEGVPVQP